MKKLFYKFASVILAIVGFIVSIAIYFLHSHFIHESASFKPWAIIILFQTFLCFFVGRLIEKLHNRSNTDQLTGLYNRRCFYDRLPYEIERTKRTKSALSLAIIDIDNFKKINDTYGHLEGDEVLKTLSKIFIEQTRTVDTVVRWGGEEFAIVMPDTDSDGARVVAERIRKVIEDYNFCNKITVCIGIASTCEYIDIDKFVALADQALYKAKKKKNLVVCLAY